MPLPDSPDLGLLSARYESAKEGTFAVGRDDTGGTSYGKYQINSHRMPQFLQFIEHRSPEIYRTLTPLANVIDGGKNGPFAKAWKTLASTREAELGTLEHAYIKSTHVDRAFDNIQSSTLKTRVLSSKTLQNVLWSTAVQHGPETDIFNKVFREGMPSEELIRGIYAERATRFPSSKPKVRQGVQDRYRRETPDALKMLAAENVPQVQTVTETGIGAIPIPARKPERTVTGHDEASLRRVNPQGIAFIKQAEGLRTRAYQDSAGVWTIGYGHTAGAGEPRPKAGMTITREQADAILMRDLAVYEKAVQGAVKVPLNDSQFAALTSFCYNVGAENFQNSTLVRKLNAGDYDAVPGELARWVHSKGQKVQGLVNRRAAETGLWNKGERIVEQEAKLNAEHAVINQRQTTVIEVPSAPPSTTTDPRRSRTAMAVAFKHNPAQAARLYPELADAHKALETVRARTGPQSRNRAVAVMHRDLVKRIDQGKAIPTPGQAMRMVTNAIEGLGR